MNWDQVEGKWKQYKGSVKDDIDVIDGKRQQLVGKLQERYGITKSIAEKQADEFATSMQSDDREEENVQRKAHRAARR